MPRTLAELAVEQVLGGGHRCYSGIVWNSKKRFKFTASGSVAACKVLCVDFERYLLLLCALARRIKAGVVQNIQVLDWNECRVAWRWKIAVDE